MYTVDSSRLKEYCEKILLGNSIPEEEAKIIADSLVDANEIGVDSHGVTRIADYMKRLEKGLIEPKTELSVVRENKATILYDANNGWGQYAGKVAMQKAIDKAKECGTAISAVQNSNHFGTASYFARMAAKQGCIGIVMTNASPLMVAWGSKRPTLGTNPICIAAPTNQHPVVLDMATSTVARGKINLAAKNNQRIPEGWAITKDGKPTTDAQEALDGYLLPFGAKGSGLAIMIDIMTGVLTGSLFGDQIPLMYDGDEPQTLGHMFIVIDINSFMDIDVYKERMQDRIEQTVKGPAADGVERVFMPGDIEQNKREKVQSEGLVLTEAIFNELKMLGKQCEASIESILISYV